MTDLSVGDMARAFILSQHGAKVKKDLQNASAEMTSGLVVDPSAHLNGDVTQLASLRNSLAQMQGFSDVNRSAGLVAEAMQTALATIDAQASHLSSVLITTAAGGEPASLAAVGYDSEQAFGTAISALNTRFAGRSLFAGQSTDVAPTATATSILDDIETLAASAVSAEDVGQIISDYFADGGTFDTTVYQGGVPMAAVAVSPDERAQLDTTAIDPAIKDTLKGLAMAAMLNRNVLSGSNSGRAALAENAGLSLMGSQQNRALLAAHIGTVQARIADADTRNQAQITSLQIAQSDLLAADPYETATKLQLAQTQLETLYTITARLSRLTLTEYL